MFSKNIKDIELEHYNALKGHRFGILWNLNAACIFIRDIDLIKKIQVSDFEHFTDLGNHLCNPPIGIEINKDHLPRIHSSKSESVRSGGSKR